MDYRSPLREPLVVKAIEYLCGKISLDQLEDWILPKLQRILDSGDDTAETLAHGVLALSAHLSEEVISEEQLKADLLQILPETSNPLGPLQESVSSETSTSTVNPSSRHSLDLVSAY